MLAKLFGSQARVKVLSLFMLNVDCEYYLREIAQKTGLAIRSVQRAVEGLVEIEILQREARGNSVYFRLNKRNPILEDLKAIFLKTVGLGDLLRGALSRQQSVQAAFIYGSVAKGEETMGSDIDLALIGSISPKDSSALLSELEDHVGREINATVFSPKEWEERMESGDHFVTTLLREPKIILIGHDVELKQLGLN